MEVNKMAMESLIRRFTGEAKIFSYVNTANIGNIIKEIKSLKVSTQVPIIDPYLIMENGAFCLEDQSLQEYSPEIFALNKLNFSYYPQRDCPLFLDFLKESVEDPERIQFIKAYFWAVLYSHTEAQVFVYLLGKGGTGKSTLANILKCLLGDENVLTTTLRDLHTDKFEAYNIIGKKLILVSDTEHYQGDLTVLKSISGGDALQGRIKHQSGSYEVHPVGLVLIIGNSPLGSRDAGGSITRRARVLTMDVKPTHTKTLITYKPTSGWQGDLVHELPGIFNWAIQSNSAFNKQMLLNTFQMIPKMDTQLKITQEELNPMVQWFRLYVSIGPGAFLGTLITPNIDKLLIETVRRGTLYPSYYIYMKQSGLIPLNKMKFLRDLINVCDMEGTLIEKIRRSQGIFIKGISLKRERYERDNLLGAPLEDSIEAPRSPEIDLTTPLNKGHELEEVIESKRTHTHTPIYPMGYNMGLKGSDPLVHPSLRSDIYTKYITSLGKTDLKDHLNDLSKDIARTIDIELLTDNYMNSLSGLSYLDEKGSSLHIPTDEFRNHVRGLYAISLDKVKLYGAIPYKYKSMGLSPRIIPQDYGKSFNSIKKEVRFLILKSLTQSVKELGYVIVDVDIKSCYTSIVLGLYPQELQALQIAIQGKGIWKYIENEFKEANKEKLYNKPVVKICTYSSFFLGGNKAMINGTLEHFRKELGMTKSEFRATPLYEGLYNQAQGVASVMQNSSIISDFRLISEKVFQMYEDQLIIGPTGHNYLVNKDTFLAAYPNYLQSYEFALLAESTLRLIDNHSKCILMGHFHDGNLMLVPKDQVNSHMELFNSIVKDLGTELGLLYPQALDINIL